MSKRFLIVAALASVALSPCVCEEEGEQIYEGWFAQQTRGDYVLGGKVVDEAGRPLDGVHLTVQKGRLIGPVPYTDEEKTTIDRTFNLRMDQYSGIMLSFSKTGYAGQRCRFSHMDWSSTNANPPGTEVKNGRVVNTNLIVTLTELENLVDLLEHDLWLEFQATGGGALLDASLPPHQSCVLATNLFATNGLPDSGVFLVAACTDEGIALVEPEGAHPSLFYAKDLRLKMLSRKDGFLPYGQATGRSVSSLFREMTSAPLGGYVSELSVPAGTGGSVPSLFYCRIGGKYGKGCVLGVSHERPNGMVTSVRVRVKVRMQQDGSRDLKTAR